MCLLLYCQVLWKKVRSETSQMHLMQWQGQFFTTLWISLRPLVVLGTSRQPNPLRSKVFHTFPRWESPHTSWRCSKEALSRNLFVMHHAVRDHGQGWSKITPAKRIKRTRRRQSNNKVRNHFLRAQQLCEGEVFHIIPHSTKDIIRWNVWFFKRNQYVAFTAASTVAPFGLFYFNRDFWEYKYYRVQGKNSRRSDFSLIWYPNVAVFPAAIHTFSIVLESMY